MTNTQEPNRGPRSELYGPCADYHWAFRVYMACKSDAAKARWLRKLEHIKTKFPKEGCL